MQQSQPRLSNLLNLKKKIDNLILKIKPEVIIVFDFEKIKLTGLEMIHVLLNLKTDYL